MSAESDKKIRYGVTALVLASIACESAVTLITPTVLPDSNNPDSSEVIPSSEVNESFTGNFEWSVDQDIMDAIAQGTGLPSSDISGFSISINRDVLGLTPHKVEFGTSQGPDLAQGKPVVRDYVFPDGDPTRPDPLYREAFDKDGHSWIREYRYDAQSNKHTVLEYPASGNDMLANGQGFDMLYYPTDDVKAQLLLSTDPSTDSKPILVNVEPKSQNSVVTTAPTPFSIQPVSYVYPEPATPTPMPPSPTPPPTPELPTATPEAKYSCPLNPESANIQEVHLAEDIQSGKLAKWALALPQSKTPIAKNPSYLDFNVSSPGDNIQTLSAASKDPAAPNPGWPGRRSRPLGICKISPSEFGIPDKSDAYLLVSVIQDSHDNRAVQLTITSQKLIKKLYYSGWLTDPDDIVVPTDKISSVFTQDFIEDGAKAGDTGDLRPLLKHKDFYGAQGTSIQNIDALFEDVSATDTFSESTIQTFNTTIMYGLAARASNP